MKNIINILILIALLVVIGLKLMENKKIVEDKVYHFDKEQPINVITSTLKLNENSDNYQITGNFMPNKDARINSEMQGKIIAINVNEGSYVRKGQRLIKLDNSILKLQLQSLDIKIKGLEVDVKRFKILADADAIQGVQLEKAELGLKSVNAQRNTILKQIKKTSVYAPFNGIITKKMTEVGSFAAPGMPLLQLTDIKKLKFTVNVPESDLGTFELNKKYAISVDAFPDLQLVGKTSMIGSRGNMGNSYPVQFEVNNSKDLKIKSGMFGKITLEESSVKKSIVIPASAIVGSNINPQVYLVTGNKAILHNIIISRKVGNKAIIGSGLSEGDEIVTSGFINLYDGANITTN